MWLILCAKCIDGLPIFYAKLNMPFACSTKSASPSIYCLISFLQLNPGKPCA